MVWKCSRRLLGALEGARERGLGLLLRRTQTDNDNENPDLLDQVVQFTKPK